MNKIDMFLESPFWEDNNPSGIFWKYQKRNSCIHADIRYEAGRSLANKLTRLVLRQIFSGRGFAWRNKTGIDTVVRAYMFKQVFDLVAAIRNGRIVFT